MIPKLCKVGVKEELREMALNPDKAELETATEKEGINEKLLKVFASVKTLCISKLFNLLSTNLTESTLLIPSLSFALTISSCGVVIFSLFNLEKKEEEFETFLNLTKNITTSFLPGQNNLIIGQPTAEQVKLKIGAAVPLDEEMSAEVQGQDQVTGLPREITLTTSEVVEAFQEPLHNIVESVRLVMEKTPPELVADVIDRGIALCGGGALLRGLDRLMTKELGVPAYLVDNPQHAAVIGAARGLEHLPVLRRHLLSA
jgi:hypothetical protein